VTFATKVTNGILNLKTTRNIILQIRSINVTCVNLQLHIRLLSACIREDTFKTTDSPVKSVVRTSSIIMSCKYTVLLTQEKCINVKPVERVSLGRETCLYIFRSMSQTGK
jgi:hypothetical protein